MLAMYLQYHASSMLYYQALETAIAIFPLLLCCAQIAAFLVPRSPKLSVCALRYCLQQPALAFGPSLCPGGSSKNNAFFFLERA